MSSNGFLEHLAPAAQALQQSPWKRGQRVHSGVNRFTEERQRVTAAERHSDHEVSLEHSFC